MTSIASIIVMVVNGLPRWLELIKQSREKHDQLLEALAKELSDRSTKAEEDRLRIQVQIQGQNQVVEGLVAKYNSQTEILANSLDQVLILSKDR